MKIAIEGMHCDACVRRVVKALEQAPGVQVETVDIGSANVSGSREAAVEAIRKAGYEPREDA